MYFNETIANQFGVNAAIILQNFAFWINRNKENGSNLKDGKHWTYITLKGLKEKFPFLSSDKIRYSISKLIDAGILTKGNFNKTKYDRTLWYSFNDDDILSSIISGINKNSQMDKVVLQIPTSEIPQPIPDIKTDINKDVEEVQDHKHTTNKNISNRIDDNITTISVNNSFEEDTTKIIDDLKQRKLSKSQINEIISSYSSEYINDKVKLYDFVEKNDSKKMKNKARFLYMAIKDDWTDDLYELSKRSKQKEDKEFKQQQDIKKRDGLEKEYNKYLEIECKKEFNNMKDSELKEIDDQIKLELNTPFYISNKSIYDIAFESKRVNAVLNRISHKILTFEGFIGRI